MTTRRKKQIGNITAIRHSHSEWIMYLAFSRR